MSSLEDAISDKSSRNLAELLKSRWIPSREPDCDQLERLGKELEVYWIAEIKRSGRRKASLSRAIFRRFGSSFFVCAFWEIVGKCFFGISVAILLGLLIGDIQTFSQDQNPSPTGNETNPPNVTNQTLLYDHYDDNESELPVDASYARLAGGQNGTVSQNWAWHSTRSRIVAKSVFLFICLCGNMISSQYYLFHSTYIGMKCRLAISYLIYKKALKISLMTLETTTSGQIVNLIASDVNKFDSAFYYIQYIYIAPLHTLVVFLVLGQFYLGPLSVLIGASVVFAYLVMQFYLGSVYGKHRTDAIKLTDERVRAMGELIDSISIVKMYAWEEHFERNISKMRKDEMGVLRKVLTLRAINLSFFYGACKLILMVIFVAFVLMGNKFNSIIIFTALTLTNSMRTYLTLFFPYSVAQVSEIRVSIERIRQFLVQDEIKPAPRPPTVRPRRLAGRPDDWSLSVAFGSTSRAGSSKSKQHANSGELRQSVSHSEQSLSRRLKLGQSLQRWHDKRRLSFITPQSSAQSPLAELPEPATLQLGLQMSTMSSASIASETSSGWLQAPAFSRLGAAQTPQSSGWSCHICSKFDNNRLLIDKRFAIVLHEVSVAWPKTSADTTVSSCGSSSGAAIKSTTTLIESAPDRAQEAAGGQATIFNNLTAHIRHHEFVMIVGRVGSGKSSLLMTLLNELPIQAGSIRINGRLAYASQEPWLFSGTIRENITIAWLEGAGRKRAQMPERLERRYKEVLRVCCLERDISIMPYGDLTNVGERGSALSGGQKARINLARALFYEADIYLLDDPLSAVDSAVAKFIFEQCFKSFLRKRTVLLVTHQVQLSTPAQKVLLLHDSPHFSYGPAMRVLFKQFNLDPSSALPVEPGEERRLVPVAVNEDPSSSNQQAAAIAKQAGGAAAADEAPLGEIETTSLIKSLQSDELLQGLSSQEEPSGNEWGTLQTGCGQNKLCLASVIPRGLRR